MSNLEYITQARKLLSEEYNTKHTNEYNNWLVKQQLSWMQPHVIVPFPPFVISAALTPFKSSVLEPSEDDIVAKALELYNRANPPVSVAAPEVATTQEIISEPVIEVEPVVEEIIPEPVIEVEPIPEVVIDNIVEEDQPKAPAISYTDAIYKIYEVMKKEGELDNGPKFTTVDATLQTIPQPAEELAKTAKTTKAPTMMEKLQSIWSTKGGGNV